MPWPGSLPIRPVVVEIAPVVPEPEAEPDEDIETELPRSRRPRSRRRTTTPIDTDTGTARSALARPAPRCSPTASAPSPPASSASGPATSTTSLPGADEPVGPLPMRRQRHPEPAARPGHRPALRGTTRPDRSAPPRSPTTTSRPAPSCPRAASCAVPAASNLVEETQVWGDRVRPIATAGNAVEPLLIDDFAVEPADDPVIGPELVAARTRLGLTVDQLAERTRIRPHVIESIEVDDFAPCGGDFYARGHLRTLARVLGVDVAPLLASYDERYADAPIDPRRVFEAELATGATARSAAPAAARTGRCWSPP